MVFPVTPIDVPAAPRRKKRIVLVAAAVAVVLIGFAVTLALVGRGHKVRYEVETSSGTARMIAWDNGDGDLVKTPESLDDQATTPWSITETFEESGVRVGVAADIETGTAICRLYIDGRLVDQSQGTVGALCEATIP